jgi:hypothetical protein
MKAKDFVLIALVIGGFAFLYITLKKETKVERDRAVDSLYRSHEVLIDMDSVERRIAKRIVDSVLLILEPVQRDLKRVRVSNDQLRKQNEELLKEYKSRPIDRPNF